MILPRAPLEDWLRDYYFEATVDISSSGVEPYTFGELQQLLDLDAGALEGVSFRDSRSAGADRIRRLVAARYGSDDPSRVIVAHGSTEAQLLVLAATLRPGDEVVVVHPAYHSLVGPVQALGCRVTPWHLRPEEGFRPNLDDLERLVNPRTRMVVVNFPHNPTGVTLTDIEQRRLVEIVARHEAFLFWDGAFEDLAFDRSPLPPVTALYEFGMSFGTMSKSFGLPGLRVGWGVLPSAAVVRSAVAVRDYTTLALSPLVELIALAVLERADIVLASRLRLASTNRVLVATWLRDHAHLISCAGPNAGVVVFPRLTAVRDTEAFCHRLMENHRVLLVPGECFEAPGYARLGFGGDSEVLQTGLRALATALAEASA